jgi:hypothetical protein
MTAKNIAKHMREVFLGGNWTYSNLKDNLDGVSWKEATIQIHDLNTIATLVNHMTYYVKAVNKVLAGEPLVAKDELSFDHPPIHSQKDWEDMVDAIWPELDVFVSRIEKLPEDLLWKDFTDTKYGIYYRNLNGIIEHTHYHLGQIALLKKILRQRNAS